VNFSLSDELLVRICNNNDDFSWKLTLVVTFEAVKRQIILCFATIYDLNLYGLAKSQLLKLLKISQ
jgi:hypothetical protein